MPVAQLTDPEQAAFISRCEGLPPVEWPPAPPMRLWAALDERTPQGRKGLRVLLNVIANQPPTDDACSYEWADEAYDHLRRLQPLFDADWKRERAALRSKQG
jgi:hypothetical protein